MQYFGVPKCPYCKKRVNLVRTWSLKRQGEYQCPRCGGISNIFLSPLIYVFALLAVFAGGAVYFFHKFILDDVSFSTLIQVLIPFALFFFLSLFLVYLAKPVIKKASRSETKRRGRRSPDNRTQSREASSQMFYDDQEYLPQTDYRTGPLPLMEDDRDMKVLPPSPRQPVYREEPQKRIPARSVPEEPAPVRRTVSQQVSRPAEPRQSSAQRPRSTSYGGETVPQPRRTSPASRTASQSGGNSARRTEVPAPERRSAPVSRPSREVQAQSAVQRPEAVSSVSRTPVSSDDFFAKYDDPEYVERRLRELKEKRDGQ